MPHFQLGWANGDLNKDRKGFTYTFKDGRDEIISPAKETLWSEYGQRKARDGFKNSPKMSNEEWDGESVVVQVKSASIPATKQRQQAKALCRGGVKLPHMERQKLRVDTKTRSVGPELKTPGGSAEHFLLSSTIVNGNSMKTFVCLPVSYDT